ncbi:MAG: CinA family protein [Halobacteriaceae archaeon]
MSVDPEAVVSALADADQTVAVAEGVTGGLVCARLTDVPGASDVLERGYVPYAYDALRTQLGVDRETLDEHGAVSEPVARVLARRARDRADATWGVATVGVAGPGGGTADRPVGTVVAGLAHAAPWGTRDSWARADRRTFDGDRRAVRDGGAAWALARLHEAVVFHGSD